MMEDVAGRDAVPHREEPGLRELRAMLGLSQEGLARAIDVSARTVERWESAGRVSATTGAWTRIEQLAEIGRLGREVYGRGFRAYLDAPNRALGGRSPERAIVRGDLDAVLDLLARDHEGQWA